MTLRKAALSITLIVTTLSSASLSLAASSETTAKLSDSLLKLKAEAIGQRIDDVMERKEITEEVIKKGGNVLLEQWLANASISLAGYTAVYLWKGTLFEYDKMNAKTKFYGGQNVNSQEYRLIISDKIVQSKAVHLRRVTAPALIAGVVTGILFYKADHSINKVRYAQLERLKSMSHEEIAIEYQKIASELTSLETELQSLAAK